MPMTRTLVMAMLIAAAAADASAQTQPPPAGLGFVNLNFGAQPSSRDFGTSQSFPLYGQNATFTTSQENGGGGMFDITAGYRFRRRSPSRSASRTSVIPSSTVTSSIPNPLVFEQPLVTTTTVSISTIANAASTSRRCGSCHH